MSYFVYILECVDKTFYTGSTCDLQKRLHEHNYTKAAAKYTRGRRPVKIVYSKQLKALSQARKKEAKIKKLTREEKIRLIKQPN